MATPSLCLSNLIYLYKHCIYINHGTLQFSSLCFNSVTPLCAQVTSSVTQLIMLNCAAIFISRCIKSTLSAVILFK